MNKYNEANANNSANIDEIMAVIKSKWQIVIALVGNELQTFNTNIFLINSRFNHNLIFAIIKKEYSLIALYEYASSFA